MSERSTWVLPAVGLMCSFRPSDVSPKLPIHLAGPPSESSHAKALCCGVFSLCALEPSVIHNQCIRSKSACDALHVSDGPWI